MMHAQKMLFGIVAFELHVIRQHRLEACLTMQAMYVKGNDGMQALGQ